MVGLATRRRTALVFAGGGSLGAIQVGMAKALERAGVEVDLFVGASVGAINAAYLAVHGLGGIAELERVWRRVQRRDVFPVGLLQALLGLVSVRESFVSPDSLRALLDRELGAQDFDDARHPLYVVATDMTDGSEVVLSRGPLLPALLASAAIPCVFPPVTIDGRALIDGGVANNTPISTAVELNAERVIVLPTGSPCNCDRFPRGAIFVAVHALNISIARQLATEASRLASRAAVVVVPPLCPLRASAYAFGATNDLIERAEERTERWIESGGLDDPAIARLAQPHGPACPCHRHG